ncbi:MULTISPECIES: DNA polymerase III subunit gamma and tau [unclassified Microbacterium]|uniref:DNA polymerase III subunit gamma and tau n=1 Tax=unclassified Microbacterium TaxID=2609290 RepID=UPI0009FB553B|nr:DNA polymerase III subunit gamma and tau [Microbacterium sp. CSI-V]MXS74151.1 DNA polymerase III subunit gamma and tau [Microbacterium sp. TL13]
MTTALYRRYRPQAFGEMIGQSQVTEPLMTALRSDRVGHAYLFSGPRGCGKTTSARILARCLNCAEGPTDTPCGVCDSCVELGRGGGGSLDVVEIDAASHNGVDDARDLRERAIFAPARDRFKIFILDEAHMVTQQGFNALLKLVEEPPAHVKFIFATTEPEKVLGTIRSRTHHYPFRLVPPAAMLEYVQELCETEGVSVEAGVLPLVVRAGGGSPRDTLSLLDQLIAGSDRDADGHVLVNYERAVALLGYTHSELLDEVVDAFAALDGAGAFAAVDRVVQTGQDPRRFVDDLLERLRDLIVVAATGAGASAVLRGVPDDELERMARQATAFGVARLSRTADLVVAALDEMTGATSPRLQLELLVARVLTHAGVSQGVSPASASAHAAEHGAPAPVRTPAPAAAAPAVAAPAVASPGVAAPVAAPAVASPGVAAPAVASPGVAAPAVASPGVAAPVVASPGGSNPRPGVAAPGRAASPVAAPAAAAAPPVAAPATPAPTADPAAAVAPAERPASPSAATAGPAASRPARATTEPTAPSDDDVPPPLDDDDAPPPFDDVEPGAAPTGPATRAPEAAARPDAASPASSPAAPHPFDTAPTPDGDAASTAAPADPAASGGADAADDSSPLEHAAPTPPVVPLGPIELSHVRDAWPEVLGQLEALSRASWLVVSTSSVLAFDDDVLTLGFRTGADLTAFKTRTADGGASEDLRRAIQSVLGVRVKYLARLEGDGGSGGSDGAPPRGPGAGPGGEARATSPAAPQRSSASYASAAVTDWAVAPIPGAPAGSAPVAAPASPAPPRASAPAAARAASSPSPAPASRAAAPAPSAAGTATASASTAGTALAVDEEPEEAAVRPAPRIAPPPFEGAVLPSSDVARSVPAPEEVDDDDVIPPLDDAIDLPVPPVIVPRMAPLRGGVQRYGEAVVRQMLGANYVRDEPYEPPTRFN